MAAVCSRVEHQPTRSPGRAPPLVRLRLNSRKHANGPSKNYSIFSRFPWWKGETRAASIILFSSPFSKIRERDPARLKVGHRSWREIRIDGNE